MRFTLEQYCKEHEKKKGLSCLPFVGRFLAQNAGSRGRHKGWGSSIGTLIVRLGHSGSRLTVVERIANRVSH